MKLIEQNPYRIAGILSGSSEKDILKQKSKIKRYCEVEKEIISNYDFPFWPVIQRSNNNIDKAFSAIEQNKDKVVHSLFWFIDLNTIDHTAIQYLINGNKIKAFEIWKKMTSRNRKAVNTRNFSAFNNLGTLYLTEQTDNAIKKGIEAKIKLIESDNFGDFVHAVADETFTIKRDKQIENLIDDLLSEFKAEYSPVETMALFEYCNGTTQNYLSKKLTEEPIHKIENQIERTKDKRTKNESNLYRLGLNLYGSCKEDLATIKNILGKSHIQYKTVADSLAKEVLQYGIDYYNKKEKINDTDIQNAKNLAQQARKCAVGNSTIQRCDENLEVLKKAKFSECYQLIELLEEIKYKYEAPTKVGTYVSNSKVKKLLKEVLSDEVIIKIAESNKENLISSYFEVTKYLFEKQGKDKFIYSKVNIFLKHLPTNSKFKEKVRVQARRAEPTVGSTISSSAKKADDYTNGCITRIVYFIIIIIIWIVVIGIISAIFG